MFYKGVVVLELSKGVAYIIVVDRIPRPSVASEKYLHPRTQAHSLNFRRPKLKTDLFFLLLALYDEPSMGRD